MKRIIVGLALALLLSNPSNNCHQSHGHEMSGSQQELSYEDFSVNFDDLDQVLIDSGLEHSIDVKQPSEFVVFLRKMVDPIMVRLITAYDYLKVKWVSLVAMIKTKVFRMKTNKR